MFGHPGDPGCFGVGVQVIFRKVMRPPQVGEGGGPLRFLAQGTGRLPVGIRAHPAQAGSRLAKQGIVEGACDLQMSMEATGLRGINAQGQFQQKGCRRAAFHVPSISS